MAYEFIQTENKEGVLVVTMHDPPTRNALGPQMADELMECLDNFEDDPSALALIKYLVHKSLSMDFEEALDLAHVAQEQVRKTEDHKEAVQAFLEKRQPEFKGR